jgi:hypothetical protein
MLIKKIDDHAEELAQLERLAKPGAGQYSKYASKDLAIRKAGIKGEAESAYLIDFYYADSPNWAVIHDLRLELNGRTAQIDHLLINRWMECYVLESKHFNSGIKITEDGEFMRWNDYKHTFEGMPSPLLQNERHIAVLGDVVNTLELPTRLGLRISFEFQSFVLVSSTARIDRPKNFDTHRVIKGDQIKERVSRDVDKIGILKTAAKIVSGDTINDVAQQLAMLHRPVRWTMAAPSEAAYDAAPKKAAPVRASRIAEPPASAPAETPKASAPPAAKSPPLVGGPRCKECQSQQGSIEYGKYGYYFKCSQCQANTKIKFTCLPQHDPRLRKAGKQFYRDCAECHSSEL